MGKIFISYRRKESADITGRLFDRLAGYFGPDSVFMDVDVLISGADYRKQIGQIIGQCDVLLAVIGEQWTTITDDTGKPRLDNSEDQLRIEIATALERGIAVIPVLVHQARLPSRDELPDDIAAVADQEPTEIQSGLPFNTDVQKLVDQLEQQHKIEHPDRRFPAELFLIPMGIIITVVGSLAFSLYPGTHQYVRERINPFPPDAGAMDYSLAGYHTAVVQTILYCTIPLGLGPLLIVGGARTCCLKKEARRERRYFSSGVGRQRMPKSRQSVACLGLGLASIGLGAVAAIPALACGVWAFIDAKLRNGWVRGRSLAAMGMIVAMVGGGFATYLHWELWQFDGWLRYVDAAEQAVADGDMEQALTAYQRSIEESPWDPFPIGVSHFKRADVLRQTDELELAIEELTKLIERCAPLSVIGDMDPASMTALVQAAYRKRAELYDAIGESDLAEQDRRSEESFREYRPGPTNDGMIDFYQETAPTPAFDEAPVPPAPVVDPSA